MRTIIEYMQLCHIHFYQKIALKKVARVNAALRSQFKTCLLRRKIIQSLRQENSDVVKLTKIGTVAHIVYSMQ